MRPEALPVDPRRPDDLDTATLLSLAGAATDTLIRAAIRERGFEVTRAHGYVFQRLLAGEQTIGELAADLGMTQQGASKHVAELERLGFVIRRVSSNDRRARVVALTDAGRAVIDAARVARRDFDDRLRSVLGSDDVAALRRALGGLLDDVGVSARIADRSIPWSE
ncbi:MarR family winged helix-turn-helix transcriptional regulator [Salinibacterium soli]|uniref:MarR family winged helix-turn-helix transcriptional regulator n=1 Tax=Antiquaquibacter soli TaxID=3064523 RepID=A0ABT9BQ50_9MICO|nr:MarR family winged helix-turn-helix transcriptional regulator [Protaetiibacter sp. WY-16]MDO7883155.1 MarR family winged helix-turn-helix transcriptional regulator [Protaetiibacter sp. WY-16]